MNRRLSPRHCVALLVLQLVAAHGVVADQTDPRLLDLFSDLNNAPNGRAAAPIEQQIWSIWFQSPNSTAYEQLSEARTTAESGALKQALALFDQLVAQHPQYAEGWNQRAIMRYLLGDIEGSLKDIEQVLELEPRHFGALSGRGQCLMRQERYREALDAFEQALDINPWIQSSARQIEMLKALISQQNKPI